MPKSNCTHPKEVIYEIRIAGIQVDVFGPLPACECRGRGQRNYFAATQPAALSHGSAWKDTHPEAALLAESYRIGAPWSG